MAAPTNAANVKKALANPEPSTHGPFPSVYRWPLIIPGVAPLLKLQSAAVQQYGLSMGHDKFAPTIITSLRLDAASILIAEGLGDTPQGQTVGH